MVRFSKKHNPIAKQKIKEFNRIRRKPGKLCFAPFKSLRFSLSGNILACCYNREYILGRYPEQTVHEVWFGKKREELCRMIAHNDLSAGCHDCSGAICSGNYYSAGALNYDYLEDTNSKYPVMLDLELSNVCNLECIMCNGENSSLIRKNREKGAPYPIVYDERFTDQLDEFIPHLNEARFVGGEPFLIDIYYTIWDKIIRINPNVRLSLLTNATVLNDRIKALLNRGNFNISVSIDSINENSFRFIRKNADFDQVMKNIEYFHTYAVRNNRWFNFNLCPIQHNWKEIPDLVRYCNEMNTRLFFHTVKFPPSVALWNLDSTALTDIANFLRSQDFSSVNEIQRENLNVCNALVKQIMCWSGEASEREKVFGKGYDTYQVSELIQLFYDHLRKACSNSEHFVLIEDRVTKITDSFTDKEALRRSLINLLKINPDTIVAEIKNSSIERLTERFIAAGT